LNRVDVLADVVRDVGTERADKLRPYEEEVRRIVRDTCSKFGITAEKRPGLGEWISFRDRWTGPGACNLGSPAVLEVDAKGTVSRVKARGKLGSTLCLSDADLRREVLAERGAQVTPFRKIDEPVKTRVVYGYDTRSYLRCGYVDEFIRDYNAHGIWTPLGCNSETRSAQKLECLTRLKLGKDRAVSLDQSSFDLNQPAWAVRLAMEEVFDAVIRSCSPENVAEVEELKRLELWAFDHATIPGGFWKQGVPSGHKWTALIDSLLNRAECLIAARIRGVSLDFGLFQGDDGLVFESGSPRMGWSEAYSELGLTVNPGKTWVERGRCEFLHEFYGGSEVRAFPARILRSILWRKPEMGSSGFLGGADKLREELDQLLKGARRGLCGLLELGLRRLRKRGLGEKASAEVFATPLHLGGLGWGRTGRRWLEIEPGAVLYRKVSLVSRVAHGDATWLRGAVVRLGAHLPLPYGPPRLSTGRVRCRDTFPKSKGFSQRRGLRTNWEWDDACGPEGPWRRRLLLEAQLRGERAWDDSLVPDPVLRTSPLGCERATRFVVRWSRKRVNLDTLESTGVPWCALADYLNRWWVGCVSAAVLRGGTGEVPRLWESLCGYALSTWDVIEPAFLNRV